MSCSCKEKRINLSRVNFLSAVTVVAKGGRGHPIFFSRITLFQSCNYAIRRGKARTMWERRSEPMGELRVTLILLFVAGPIGVHPPPPWLPLLRHDPAGNLSGTHLPSGGVASYISWLSKPLERVR